MSNLNSLVQSVVSFITYLQNLSATMNVPSIDLPDGLRKVITSVSRFLDRVLELIPLLPAFDVRAQIAIIALGLPFLLDIIFVWFVSPFFDTVFHLVDILTIIVGTMILTESIIESRWSIGSVLVVSVACLYLVLRLIVKCIRRKKKYWDIHKLTEGICNHFMAGIINGVQTGMTLADMNDAIRNFTKGASVRKVSKPGACWILFVLIIIAGLVVTSVWAIGAIPIVINCPAVIRVFFPYVGFPFAAILLFLFFMKITPCGRRGLLCLKRFCKRWGLRLLMLFLDLLYIPILTNLVTIATPAEVSCGKGNYLAYDRVPKTEDDILFEYVNHTAQCVRCTTAMQLQYEECQYLCSGISEWRLKEAPNLLMMNDVIKVCGGIMLYCVLVIMIGIPLLWSIIIRRNKKFITVVNVWGETISDKWRAAVHRIETTGIFLFAYFKIDYSYWNVFLIFSKFVVMMITTIAGRVYPNLIIALPFWYFFVVLLYMCKMPYLYFTNNVLEVILFCGNTVFAVVPVFSNFGYSMNDNVFLPLSLALIGIPFLSILVMICCKHPVYEADDASISYKDRKKQRTRHKKGQKKLTKAEKKEQRRREKELEQYEKELASLETMLDNLEMLDIQVRHGADAARKVRRCELRKERGIREKRTNQADTLEAMQGSMTRREELYEEIYRDTGGVEGENVRVEEGYMDSIDHLRAVERGIRKKTAFFNVGRHRLMVRATKMYKIIDIVIDGATIELLTTSLGIAMLMGAAAFGWYIGGLRGMLRLQHAVTCG